MAGYTVLYCSISSFPPPYPPDLPDWSPEPDRAGAVDEVRILSLPVDGQSIVGGGGSR